MAGGVASGLLVWVASGLVAWVPGAAAPYIVAAAALAAVLRDLHVVAVPLPERRNQVPKSILDQAPHRAAVGFGIELGLGFRTRLSASAPYLLLIALLLLAKSLPLFLVVGAAFGLGRFAMPAALYLSVDGDHWDALIGHRAGLIRSSSAVVAALGVLALAIA